MGMVAFYLLILWRLYEAVESCVALNPVGFDRINVPPTNYNYREACSVSQRCRTDGKLKKKRKMARMDFFCSQIDKRETYSHNYFLYLYVIRREISETEGIHCLSVTLNSGKIL